MKGHLWKRSIRQPKPSNKAGAGETQAWNQEGIQAGKTDQQRNEHSFKSARIYWEKQSVREGASGGDRSGRRRRSAGHVYSLSNHFAGPIGRQALQSLGTIGSTVCGHPGEPKLPENFEAPLFPFAMAGFGLTFELDGLRSRLELLREAK